ncbi:MAG: methyltransferase domain-containing protein [Gemmatimonadales bacterium]
MPVTPTGSNFNYSGTELDALAEAKNYYAWVMRQFDPWLGPTVIEAGAGIGTFSQFLLDAPAVRKLIAIEPGANTFPHLKSRFASNPRVEVLSGYLSEHYHSLTADAFVAVNVLEHVAEDTTFLTEARSAVSYGGSLLLFVPALPAIFGSLDRAFEHHRRYTKNSLRRVIEAAGWTVRRIDYMNFPGIAAWFMAGRILNKSRIAAPEAKAYDRLVVPWLSRVESLMRPPIGSNLVAIATKP